MIAKLGPLVSAIAGSIGGVTMQRSPGGTIVRSKPLPIQRPSRFSSIATQRTSTVNFAWRALTPTQRAAWQAFADTQTWYNRFGDPYAASGYVAFLKNNLGTLANAGAFIPLPIAVDPPVTTACPLPANLRFLYDSDTDIIFLTSSDAATSADTVLTMYVSPIVSTGRKAYSGPRTWLGAVASATTLPIVLTTAYIAAGLTQPGKDLNQSAFLRVQARNSTNTYPGLSIDLPLEYTVPL